MSIVISFVPHQAEKVPERTKSANGMFLVKGERLQKRLTINHTFQSEYDMFRFAG